MLVYGLKLKSEAEPVLYIKCEDIPSTALNFVLKDDEQTKNLFIEQIKLFCKAKIGKELK